MGRLSYRPARGSDARAISSLVKRALSEGALPGWTPHAISELIGKATVEAIRGHIAEASFAHVAVADRRVAGFILCKHARFLNLLVVEPSLQRRGIGSHLVRSMLQHLSATAPELSVVELNATEASLPFYRRLGFYPLSEFVEFGGCRFARLGFWRRNPVLSQARC